jgi:hypothetical protein
VNRTRVHTRERTWVRTYETVCNLTQRAPRHRALICAGVHVYESGFGGSPVWQLIRHPQEQEKKKRAQCQTRRCRTLQNSPTSPSLHRTVRRVELAHDLCQHVTRIATLQLVPKLLQYLSSRYSSTFVCREYSVTEEIHTCA